MTKIARMFLLVAVVSLPASVRGDDLPTGTVRDRAGFLPLRKQASLPRKAMGILLAEGQAILTLEGRSGPADQLVFSSGGNSYRWVYVPTQDKPLIANLPVVAGEQGHIKQTYPALDMANPRSVSKWTITEPYTLVEAEVNANEGSPKGDSFVATSFRVVEGSRAYPLRATDMVKDAKDRYKKFLAEKQPAIEKTLKETAEKILRGKPVTGPREREELMYVTWMPDTETMRVHFKTVISDGAYTVIGGGDDVPRPLPKALPKGMLRIAPPRNFGVKVGITFGLELGQAYIANKEGKLIRSEELPIETFVRPVHQRQGGMSPFPKGGPMPKGPTL